MGKESLIRKVFWGLFLLLAALNFLTTFVPEIGFDALWYHLTLPKLWLLKNQWYFSGGLLYYSAMPRLTEIIFTPLIAISGYVGPKLLQFTAGLLISLLIFKIGKLVGLSKTWCLTAANLFYLSWLVSWQSGSAYIDLFRTLLETFALYFFIQKKPQQGSIFLGLAVGTKWLSLGSLAIFAFVFGFNIVPLALLVALPWFVIAYLFTNNPIYPIFSVFMAQQNPELISSLKNLLLLPYKITLPFDDFISPVAGLLVSLAAVNYLLAKNNLIKRISLIGVLGAIISVILNPPSSRFFLPYLPATVIGAVLLVSKLQPPIQKAFLYLFGVSFLVVIVLRLIAFQKNLPYLLGQQTQNQYLSTLATRLPGTFIDSDGFVQANLNGQKILIDKLHNLYYFPYNFDHTSWINNRSNYDYLVTYDTKPEEIGGYLVHTNNLGIQIYKLK